MSRARWECQHSVDVDVPAAFAWQYMTNVGNWSDPPAEFTLDGPFTSGVQGTTRMPGQPPVAWTVRDVDDGRAYTIDGGSLLENARRCSTGASTPSRTTAPV